MDGFDEVKRLLDEQGRAFEEFKSANDRQIAEIKKGSADAVTADKVERINKALDDLGDRVKKAAARSDEIEARLNRPGAGGAAGDGTEAKDASTFAAHVRLAYQLKGRAAPLALDGDATETFREYRRAFGDYLRKGSPDLWGDAERKALSVGSDPDGGYLVVPDVSGRMVSRIYETSPIRQIASVQTISTDALRGPQDHGEVAGGWVGETSSRPVTDTSTLGEWRIPVFELYAMPEATQQFLDDAAVDVEGWLARKVGDKLGRIETTAFCTGAGVASPRGFLTYTTAATGDGSRAWGVMEHVATGTSGGFGSDPNGSDKLIDLVHRLKSAYRNGARWLMSRTTLGAARKLKANGDYIWLPSMTAGQNSTLLGFPVTEAEDMPAIAADSLSIAFGDFAQTYQIVDRQGFRTVRDPLTNKPFVRFYTTRRVGGDVLNFESLKFLRFATS